MLVVWVLGGGAPRLQVCDIPSLHPAEVGQDKNRVVGRDTGIDVRDHFCQGCHGETNGNSRPTQKDNQDLLKTRLLMCRLGKIVKFAPEKLIFCVKISVLSSFCLYFSFPPLIFFDKYSLCSHLQDQRQLTSLTSPLLHPWILGHLLLKLV